MDDDGIHYSVLYLVFSESCSAKRHAKFLLKNWNIDLCTIYRSIAVLHSPTVPLQILAGPGSGKTKVDSWTGTSVKQLNYPLGSDVPSCPPYSPSWHSSFLDLRRDFHQQSCQWNATALDYNSWRKLRESDQAWDFPCSLCILSAEIRPCCWSGA